MAKPSDRSPERELQVVLSVLRGELSATEAARRAGVAEQTVHNWIQARPLADDGDLMGDGKKSTDRKPAAKESGSGSGPRLLSGGNPQIPKGEGDGPVQDYIAAMPGWKRSVGERLDELIVRMVPDVHKAVKWNSPFYGLKGEGWFLAFHCFNRYIKVTFFRATSLRPVPPEAFKVPETRYFHIYENDDLDESPFASWVKQASNLRGEKL